ncbi:hypothetical protein [Bacillus sp. FJAT-27245]|nr:hypothetical protein [Bacillus sp. FJAT-27245]
MEKKQKRPVYKPKAQPGAKPETPKKKKGCGCGGSKKRNYYD